MVCVVEGPGNLIAIEYPLSAPNMGTSAQDVKVADGLMFIGFEGGSQSVEIVDVHGASVN